MITTDAKCHNYEKKNSDRKRSILKEERTSERKCKQNIEDTDDKDTDMECGAVWFRNMDYEERIAIGKEAKRKRRRTISPSDCTERSCTTHCQTSPLLPYLLLHQGTSPLASNLSPCAVNSSSSSDCLDHPSPMFSFCRHIS